MHFNKLIAQIDASEVTSVTTKPKGKLYYLPTEAAAIIIQYNPDFRFTVLIPPAERDIQISVNLETFSRLIKTPALLLSHLCYPTENFVHRLDRIFPRERLQESASHIPWCECEFCNDTHIKIHRSIQQYYLFALDPNFATQILAQPYRMNNVYEDGRCCFTRLPLKAPQTLKQAQAKFWSDYFSAEFMPPDQRGWHIHKCETRRHGGEYNNETVRELHARITAKCGCPCCAERCNCPCECNMSEKYADFLANYTPKPSKYEDYTQLICGINYLSFPKSADAIFTSANPEFLTSIPERLHYESSKYRTPFTVGLATQQTDNWLIDFNGHQIELPATELVLA